jgi:hypothetical protein
VKFRAASRAPGRFSKLRKFKSNPVDDVRRTYSVNAAAAQNIGAARERVMRWCADDLSLTSTIGDARIIPQEFSVESFAKATRVVFAHSYPSKNRPSEFDH